jgi:amino acid transporter
METSRLKDKRFLKPGGWWLIGLVSAAGIAVTGVAYYQLSQMSAPKKAGVTPFVELGARWLELGARWLEF